MGAVLKKNPVFVHVFETVVGSNGIPDRRGVNDSVPLVRLAERAKQPFGRLGAGEQRGTVNIKIPRVCCIPLYDRERDELQRICGRIGQFSRIRTERVVADFPLR